LETTSVGDGTALNTSTSETSILPTYAKWIIEAGFFNRPGDELFVEATGRLSCIVTTPGTLTLKVKFGSVAVWDSGAINLNVVAKTNLPWTLRVPLTCRAVGSGTSANLIGVGELMSESLVGAPAASAGGNTPGYPEDDGRTIHAVHREWKRRKEEEKRLEEEASKVEPVKDESQPVAIVEPRILRRKAQEIRAKLAPAKEVKDDRSTDGPSLKLPAIHTADEVIEEEAILMLLIAILESE
jgi:hypothetical protein